MALPAYSAPDDELIVVSERDLSKYWVLAGSTLSNFEISGTPKLQFGCANIGFVIEASGTLAPPLRVLSYRFNRELPDGAKIASIVAADMGSASPKFAALPGVVSPSAIFTSLSVPIRSTKLSRSLGKEDSDRLDRALVDACRVDDLAGRLSKGPGEAVKLDPLPSLAEFLQQSKGE
jgi:hypothetical protein